MYSKAFLVATILALALCLGGIAQADVFNLGTGFTNLETVAVGTPNNPTDAGVYGSVGYTYNIGKYEVTAKQYTDFLNAKAATDTYSLYNTNMADTSSTSMGCGIQRSGSAGSYSYSVASDYANRPVNYVNFWDAVRFANWLGNGQGTGNTEDGTYTLTTNGITNNTIVRNTNWTWAVTSENEWYKAAYFDQNVAGGKYWLYPTRSDTSPGRDMADPLGDNANWGQAGVNPYPIDSNKYYTTVAGEFQNSASAYGTFDQGGNVWEYTDTIISASATGDSRVLRGGSFYANNNVLSLAKSYQNKVGPTWETNRGGFRLSQSVPVPEPGSMLAMGSGLIGLAGFAIRRRRA